MRKVLPISPEILLSMMTENEAWRVEKGIPKDAVFRGVTYDEHKKILYVFMDHPSFEDSKDNYLDTLFRRLI